METGAQSVAGRLVAETVNDFLPGDPGSFAGKIGGPELPESVKRTSHMAVEILGDPFVSQRLPETDGPDYVRLPRDVARLLLLASDVLSEHWKTMVSATPQLTIVDIQVDTIDVLTEAGLVDPDSGGVTEAFEAALAIAGAALGMPLESAAGREPTANGEAAPRGAATSGVSANDDGAGIDDLAGANDDYEDDVRTAEGTFARSPDDDWPGEPVTSVLDALPRAGSFAHD